MVTLAYRSWLLYYRGHASAALEHADAAVERARATEHPFTLSYALCFSAWIYTNTGDYRQARELLLESARVTESHQLQLFAGLTDVLVARLELLRQAPDAGNVADMVTAMDTYGLASARLFMPIWHTELAATLAALNDQTGARRHLDRARSFADEGDEFWAEPLWWSIEARWRARAGDDAGADAARSNATASGPFEGMSGVMSR